MQPGPLPSMPQPPLAPGQPPGFDPWAAAAAVAHQAGSGGEGTSPVAAGMVPSGPLGPPPPSHAPGTFPISAQSQAAAGTSQPQPSPSAPQTVASDTFAGRGGLDASKTVTGITAEFLLRQKQQNIEARIQARNLPNAAWRVAGDLASHHGKREAPGWDGKDPGRTLRPWLRSQLHWQVRTPSPPEQWGILLYDALPVGSLSRTLAETVPDVELMQSAGYTKILRLILQAHQAYLEVELEKATVDFLFPRSRERNELFTAYVAHLELLARELDQQLHPAPPLDERIKAIILLRNCQLEKEQRTQLALKRAGTQSFQEVADQLRTLDRPEAFLQQANAAAATKKAFPVALDPPEAPLQLEDQQPVDLRTAVKETIEEMFQPFEEMPPQEDADEYASNEDFDAEGQLKLDFDEDAEYSEPEALQILA